MTLARLGSQPRRISVHAWLRLAVIWHALVTLVALIGSLSLALGAGPAASIPAWARITAAILLALLALASSAALFAIRRRVHRGRVLSLLVNYLGVVACLLGLLHTSGVFLGLDAAAERMGRGLPFLLLLFLGYLISALGDRFQHTPALEQRWRRAGRWVMILSGLAALLAMGVLSGLASWVRQVGSWQPLGLLVAGLLFALMFWALWREPGARALNAHIGHEQMLNGFLFLSPNLLGFLLFFAGPLFLSFYTSFTNWDAFSTREWVGLDNYREILDLTFTRLETPAQRATEVLDVTTYDELTRFSLGNNHFIIGAADKLFWLALKNTLVFALIAVPLSSGLALILANLLNSRLPGMKLFRAIYFLPSIAAVVGIALVWQWLFNSTIGFINYGITGLVTFLDGLGLEVADPHIRWLSESRTALLAIIIVSIWQSVGFNTVLFLAGLQTIPHDLYEAATVDGAGKMAQFFRITIPMLAPTTFFVISTTTIQALQLFEQVFIMTNPVGGPNNATLTLTVYLYQNGFQFFKQGYGSAIAWLLFIVIFGVTLAQFRRQRRNTLYA